MRFHRGHRWLFPLAAPLHRPFRRCGGVPATSELWHCAAPQRIALTVTTSSLSFCSV